MIPERHIGNPYISYKVVESGLYAPFFHREDGPAMIDLKTGGETWVQHNVYHRLDGPAVIEWNGSEEWYCGGNLHRDWGPAEIRNGKPRYYFYGNQRERYENEPES